MRPARPAAARFWRASPPRWLPNPNFAQAALASENPVNHGSHCTVFMNSKVKQVQKVINIRQLEDLRRNIIVQGGTFYNEAVQRAFELLTGRTVVGPDIDGVMGAYGCALIARENAGENSFSTILGPDELETFQVFRIPETLQPVRQ